MTCRISHTTVDAHDAYHQSVWWSEVLSMYEDPEDPNEPGHEECMIFSADGRTRILFIEVPDDKQVKNRVHFDLRPVTGTRDEEVERLDEPRRDRRRRSAAPRRRLGDDGRPRGQ